MEKNPKPESTYRFFNRTMGASALGIAAGTVLMTSGGSVELNRECPGPETVIEEFEEEIVCDGNVESIEIPVRTAAGGATTLFAGVIGISALGWKREIKKAQNPKSM